MVFRRIKIVLVACFFILFISCESEDTCEQTVISTLKAGFYSIQDSIPEAISVDNFTAYGIGRSDSLIYDGENSVSSFELPLSPSSDTTGFIFTLDTEIDTIIFIYNREFHLLSMECGFTTYFEIDGIEYTLNAIDSVSIIKKTATTGDDENIQIYI